jgi:uncharacterized protein YceK
MKNINLSIAVIALLILSSTGCKKDDPKQQPQPTEGANGTLQITMDLRWGPTLAPFSMNTWYVHPGTSDSLRFNNIKIYISNIKLKRADGTWWTEPESYRLVDANRPNGLSMNISNIPAGEYTEMQWMVGVDSARNVSGIQSGALDPSLGMFWTWTTGYIFIKAEGFAPAAPQGNFQYHLGGFSGPNNSIQIRNFNISATPLKIVKDANSQLSMRVNMARFWHGGVRVENTHTIHMSSAMAAQMAANFADGFMVGSVANP